MRFYFLILFYLFKLVISWRDVTHITPNWSK